MNEKNQDLGREISQRLRWSGEDIVEVFQAALEDANYHQFNRSVGKIWRWFLKSQEGVYRRAAERMEASYKQ